MLSNSLSGITRLTPLGLTTLQQRRAELLDLESPPEPPDQQPPQSSLPSPSALELEEAALHGPAGDAVRTLAPHTEAHPAAILLQLLAAFGNAVGPGPHCMVDDTRHGLNLFLVLVGESSKARNGTSWNQVARLFSEVDRPWLDTRVTTARLTATALVYHLCDQQPPTDRRLLALAEEFAPVLHTLVRTLFH